MDILCQAIFLIVCYLYIIFMLLFGMLKMMDATNEIFKAAYEAVLPHRLIRNAISVDQSLSIIQSGRKYPLHKNVYVAAFGKAACGMSRAVDDMLHDHIVDGVVSMPFGTVDLFRRQNMVDMIPRNDTILRYFEGAKNNLPDENAHKAALEIKQMVEQLTKDDLLLVLISGGGSALLPCPPNGVTLEDKTTLIKLLSKRGADIGELNKVRQQLSQLKGGRLAQLAMVRSTPVISLIISDVVGDPLDIIASGPTVPRKSKASDAVAIIQKYLGDSGTTKEHEHTLKIILDYLYNTQDEPESSAFARVDNVIIGNNRSALEAARSEAERRQFEVTIVNDSVIGEARLHGRNIARHLRTVLAENIASKRRCWLWGGETTVHVKGDGRGGRNQEMVLSFISKVIRMSLLDHNHGKKFAFLSAGTDGQDGPTDAAGAMIDSEEIKGMKEEDIRKMEECLETNDSYKFLNEFRDGRCHVKYGLTGTNVMDVQIFLVE